MLYPNKDSHTLGSISLTNTHTDTQKAGRRGLFIGTYVRVERTFSCPYSCLRLTGNIRLFLARSLPPSFSLSQLSLVLISRSYLAHLSLSAFTTHLFLCVGEPCFERWSTGTISCCWCAQWLQIVTSCAPASESCKVKKEFVLCIRERQLGIKDTLRPLSVSFMML